MKSGVTGVTGVGGRLGWGIGFHTLLILSPVVAVAACGDAPAEIPPAHGAPHERLLEAGEATYRSGDFEAALMALDSARQAAEAAGDDAARAVALTWLGLAHYQLGSYREARLLGEEALDLKQRLGLTDELARSYNALGLLAWMEGRLEDALVLHGRSLETAQAEDDVTGVARSQNNLALVRSDLGDLTGAAERYDSALVAFQALELPQFQGRVLTNQAALYMEWGDVVRAEQALARAFRAYAEAEDPVGEVNALGQLGVVYAAQGDPQRGLQYLDSALTVARGMGLRAEEASNLEQLAVVHSALGSTRLARDLYRRAQEINRELGLSYEEGANLRARGALDLEAGRLEEGGILTREALERHRALGAGSEVVADLLQLAEFAAASGDDAAAAGHLDEAAGLANDLGSARADVLVALTRAELAAGRAAWAQVIAALDAVAAVLEEVPVDLRWHATLLRARALEAAGDGRALVVALDAVDLVEQVRSSLASDLLRNTVARARADTYHLVVDLLLREGRLVEAFQAADASRSRAVARRLAASAVGADVERAGPADAGTEALLARVSHLDARLDEIRTWYPPGERDQAFRREEEAILDARDEARRLLSRRLVEGNGSGRSGSGGRPSPAHPGLDVSVLRDRLAPDEALVSFLSTRDRLLSFVARRDTVHAVAVDVSADALESRIRVARSVVGRPGPFQDRHRRILGGLFTLLMAPLEETGLLAGADRLVVVADGPLGTLPVAALWDAESGSFLVERYALQEIPSARTLVASRERAPRRARSGSVGAGFAPEIDGLPASGDEVARFTRIFPGDAFLGSEATEYRLREALASDAVVHAAAHGRMNALNPLFSRLQLAEGAGHAGDDGILHVHEMLELDVAAPLVFLSGCETGVGSMQAGGGPGGGDLATLAEALLVAGAGSVVATLWPIQDRPAADFAERFYAGLGDASPPQALADAQRMTLADPRTRAPFYWAGYVVSGDARLRRAAALH